MQGTCIYVNKVSKAYPDFTLNDIDIEVLRGNIVGLVGENGAGKTTLLKLILDLIPKDNGEIVVLGENNSGINRKIFEKVGVVLDEDFLPETLNAKQLNSIMAKLYAQWSELTYMELLDKFNIPINKKIVEFSKGMKMKLSIIISLSHNAELLILDEPTTGLDPIVREEILELFLKLKEDKNVSIFFSSHITSDLEKVADNIIFIHKGNIIFSEKKMNLIGKYKIITSKNKSYMKEIPIGTLYRESDADTSCLVKDNLNNLKDTKDVIIRDASLADIMNFYIKGEVVV